MRPAKPSRPIRPRAQAPRFTARGQRVAPGRGEAKGGLVIAAGGALLGGVALRILHRVR